MSQGGWINQAQNLLTCERSSSINEFNSSSKLTSERIPPVQCHNTLYFSLCSPLLSVSANFSLCSSLPSASSLVETRALLIDQTQLLRRLLFFAGTFFGSSFILATCNGMSHTKNGPNPSNSAHGS